jgi:hypothetical protein
MGVASLCRIGLVYQNFARALFDAPVPKELNEEQRAIYQEELNNLAFPVEEKAIEAFEKALQKAYELGVYNEWTTLTQENLNKYKPGTYPELPPTRYVAKEYFYQPGMLVSAAEPKPAPKPVPSKVEGAEPKKPEVMKEPGEEGKHGLTGGEGAEHDKGEGADDKATPDKATPDKATPDKAKPEKPEGDDQTEAQ